MFREENGQEISLRFTVGRLRAAYLNEKLSEDKLPRHAKDANSVK